MLRIWTATVAATVMMSSVIQSLLPDGKTVKYVRFVCSVVLVICIISPIKSIDLDKINLDISAIFSQNGDVSYVTVLDEQTKLLYEKRLEELVKRGLQESCKTTVVGMDIRLSGKGSETVLEKMTVYIGKNDGTKVAACEYYLRKTLGFDAEIKIVQ